jgi:hypothetical protein
MQPLRGVKADGFLLLASPASHEKTAHKQSDDHQENDEEKVRQVHG